MMNSSLESAFEQYKSSNFTNKQRTNGWLTILRLRGAVLLLQVGWDIISTFIVYSPSVNSYLHGIVQSVRKNWNSLSEEEQTNVIAVLASLNRKGKVEKMLNSMAVKDVM